MSTRDPRISIERDSRRSGGYEGVNGWGDEPTAKKPSTAAERFGVLLVILSAGLAVVASAVLLGLAAHGIVRTILIGWGIG